MLSTARAQAQAARLGQQHSAASLLVGRCSSFWQGKTIQVTRIDDGQTKLGGRESDSASRDKGQRRRERMRLSAAAVRRPRTAS